MSDPLSWQAIFAALYGAYRAGRVAYEAYSSLKKYVKRKQVEGFTPAEVEGIIRRTSKGEAIFDSGAPKTHEPGEIYRQELPVRVIEGEDIHRDRHSSSSSGMRQGSCKVPPKYYDVYGSSAGTNTITGGTSNWNASGQIQPSNASAPNWTQLTTGVSAGTGGTNRAGNALCLKSLFIRFRIHPNATEATGEAYVRLLLVQDTIDVPGGSVPALSDILTFSTPTTGAMESPLNVSTFGRFKIIKDEVIRYRSTAACGVNCEALNQYWVLKPDNKKFYSDVLWDADGTTRGKNHLWMYAIWSNNVPASGVNVITTGVNGPGLSCYARIRFTDSN